MTRYARFVLESEVDMTKTWNPSETWSDAESFFIRLFDGYYKRQYAIKINNQLVDYVTDSMSYDDAIEERSVFTFTLWETDQNKQYVKGMPVEFAFQNMVLFRGFIEKATATKWSREGTDQFTFVWDIDCIDNHYLADKRIVAFAMENTEAGTAVQKIVDDYLSQEGVTVGAIQQGSELAQIQFNYIPASEALDKLAEAADYIWYIDHDRKIYFISRSTNAAPWSLTRLDIFGTAKVESGNPQYRNVQYIKGGRETTDIQTEIFYGDGENRTFTVGYDIAEQPTVEVSINGGEWVSQTVSVKGAEEEGQWVWKEGDKTASQNRDVEPLTDADRVRIQYRGMFPVIIRSKVDSAILDRQSVEGTGTGLVEEVEQDTSLDSVRAGLESANSMLTKYGQINTTLSYRTERSGLRPGMIQPVFLPEHGLNGTELLIESINLVEEDTIPIYEVKAVLGPASGSWTKFFLKTERQIKNIVQAGVKNGESLVIPLMFEKDWAEAERPNIFTVVLPSESTLPTETTMPMFDTESRVSYLAWYNGTTELGRKQTTKQTGASTGKIDTTVYLSENDANTTITHYGWVGGYWATNTANTGVIVDKQPYNATKTNLEAWNIIKVDRRWN
jgi:hypothetical protein